MADAVLEAQHGEIEKLDAEEEEESMAELVAKMGEDKIERKPRQRKNNKENN